MQWRSIQAAQKDVRNFSLLVSHVLVPPAMEAILSFPENRVQGFLAAGHVCAVMGYWEYEPIAAKVPCADRRDRIRACWTSCREFICASASSRKAAPKWKTSTPAP